mmetsp:Transcript_27105/g.38847  ORF Transcript_27105/g.38847 Transcript_27105/m.38847 type:complete len:673 (+) Transcript_27105:56-2074(+)
MRNSDDQFAFYDEDSLRTLLDTYPLPEQSSTKSKSYYFEYGTAGFRYPCHLLPPVVVRMGLFASLRSYAYQSLPLGAMITASHNPAVDNGIKLADVGYGRMLDDSKWENYAVQLVNAATTDHALTILKEIFAEAERKRKRKLHTMYHGYAAVVHVGRDTRPSSLHLSRLFIRAATSIFFGKVHLVDHQVVTTPMLHFFVMYANSFTLPQCLLGAGLAITSTKGCTEEGYYAIIANAYVQLLLTKTHDPTSKAAAITTKRITVDCACGVGSLKLECFLYYLEQLLQENEGLPKTHFTIVNGAHEGPLNDSCGAEFVQKNQLPPKLYCSNSEALPTGRWCSLDGDADRIVFHYFNSSNRTATSMSQHQHSNNTSGGRFCLLDGDKIAVLVALFIREELQHLLRFANLSEVQHPSSIPRYGVVQTAYANGNSTAFLRDVAKIPVQIAKTGVKHVHACAEHHYDVGIYFEPNGHGTVLFSSTFYVFLARMEQLLLHDDVFSVCNSTNDVDQQRATIALQRLRLLPLLINQAVGDAISDLFLVEAILHLWEWEDVDDFHKWNSLYTELPSRQCKVKINDRSIIQMNENETQVVSPASLVHALELAVINSGNGSCPSKGKPRCFVRPSGTEDVVRIYAEAPTQHEADNLAKAAASACELCDGVQNDVHSVVNQLHSGL